MQIVTVFADGPAGGNPAPVVIDAVGLTDDEMQAVATSTGLESAFVLPPPGPGFDLALRFWVPAHEMEMCGHATLGAVWLLARQDRLPVPGRFRVATRSGAVAVEVAADGDVRLHQLAARVSAVPDPAPVLAVLGLDPDDLAEGGVWNASTSRVKTLVPLRDEALLHSLAPDAGRVEQLCRLLDSTGLYPYVRTGPREFAARQFPRSSGYPEDPATGIAAAALVSAAAGPAPADDYVVRQGRAMGRPSRIGVRVERDAAGAVSGCWLSGAAMLRPA